ncbi:hypothetical protein P8452_07679 [Trifolium repens]|nr:hypothetical protein P8452_07679 [Trifolium repens]
MMKLKDLEVDALQCYLTNVAEKVIYDSLVVDSSSADKGLVKEVVFIFIKFCSLIDSFSIVFYALNILVMWNFPRIYGYTFNA